MEILLVLGLIFGLINEADTPKWTEDIEPCPQVEVVDVVTALEKGLYNLSLIHI